MRTVAAVVEVNRRGTLEEEQLIAGNDLDATDGRSFTNRGKFLSPTVAKVVDGIRRGMLEQLIRGRQEL
jgi:hypothetical protein